MDYYALLGVRRDASTVEIRRAYEIAIQRATRDVAIKHVMDLVRAYEVLGDAGRRRLYDSTGRAVLPDRTSNARGRAVPWRGGRPALGQLPARHARHSSATGVLPQVPVQFRWRRVLGVALSISLAGIAAGTFALFQFAEQPAEPTSQPTRLVVPASARVGPDGMVVVVCHATPAGPEYRIRVRPGTEVICGNGATPRW